MKRWRVQNRNPHYAPVFPDKAFGDDEQAARNFMDTGEFQMSFESPGSKTLLSQSAPGEEWLVEEHPAVAEAYLMASEPE